MTAAQHQRVRDLFEQAVERSTPDGRAWVAAEAADDPAVAAEVLSLLEHHDRAGEFLSNPIGSHAGDLFEDDTRFEPGAVIGQYTVMRELGSGGMARVYLATDNRLDRTVALKALRPSLTRDPAQRERLRREARAAAGLKHPGICTIYALEEINGDVFIVAEYVDGHSLREEIRQGRRPSAPGLVESARELAEALASAHAKGITHRDLKPENVMRTREGRLKILDFGLALMSQPLTEADALPRITIPGAIVGTPDYMPPEQLKGGPIDARTDVFAFGVLIYEYATGRHPFDDDSAFGRLARILESEPRPVRELRPDLPDAVAAVISGCLRKLPAERFTSAAELVKSLSSPSVAPAPSRVTAWWRNHQVITLALYLIAAVLAWQLKEWSHGFADSAFTEIVVLATIAGVFRGHLLFTERLNRIGFEAVRERTNRVTIVVDILIAVILLIAGWQLASVRPLAGTLTMALAVGIALARLLIEPTTTRAAFDAHSR